MSRESLATGVCARCGAFSYRLRRFGPQAREWACEACYRPEADEAWRADHDARMDALRAARRARAALQIGTRFEYDNAAPWSAPCAACGRRTPTHYAKGKRRRLVRCAAHQNLEGVERATLVCRVTEMRGDYFSYVVEARRDLRDTPPGHPDGQAILSGGAIRQWFEEQVASGAFRLLPEGGPR